jgi:hypothetical protein
VEATTCDSCNVGGTIHLFKTGHAMQMPSKQTGRKMPEHCYHLHGWNIIVAVGQDGALAAAA